MSFLVVILLVARAPQKRFEKFLSSLPTRRLVGETAASHISFLCHTAPCKVLFEVLPPTIPVFGQKGDTAASCLMAFCKDVSILTYFCPENEQQI